MAFEIPADPNATVYADAATVDDVAPLRVGGSAWLGLTPQQKDQITNAVTQAFDSLEFIGEMTAIDQNLEWPRTGTDYSDDAWPGRLIRAAIEYAIILAPTVAAGTDPLVAAANGNVKRKKVGPIETEYFAATTESPTGTLSLDVFPLIVQRLLAPLVRVVFPAVWGSAAVVRGS